MIIIWIIWKCQAFRHLLTQPCCQGSSCQRLGRLGQSLGQQLRSNWGHCCPRNPPKWWTSSGQSMSQPSFLKAYNLVHVLVAAVPSIGDASPSSPALNDGVRRWFISYTIPFRSAHVCLRWCFFFVSYMMFHTAWDAIPKWLRLATYFTRRWKR